LHHLTRWQLRQPGSDVPSTTDKDERKKTAPFVQAFKR
jgi:hypothetical protein